MMSNQKGISNLPDESMEILNNILGRYHTRHVNCTHAMLFITCAMLSFYSIISYHPKIITMTVSLKSLLIKQLLGTTRSLLWFLWFLVPKL